jgi:copper homeostasis protein
VTVLEICVDDVEGAQLAEQAGADRVELCSGLAEGGLTPSSGLVRQVLAGTRRVGVRVLVRPRGGDFVYSAAEVDVMVADVEALAALGDPRLGLVVGAVTPDGAVDTATTRRLLRAAGDADVTFHRAFDATADLGRSLEELTALGVPRVLTSGGRRTAVEGADVLARLVAQAAGRIAVLAGGGVRPGNVRALVDRTGVGEVHLRAAEPAASAARYRNPELPYDQEPRLRTSAAVVRAVRAALA